jgi:hypothetical protein
MCPTTYCLSALQMQTVRIWKLPQGWGTGGISITRTGIDTVSTGTRSRLLRRQHGRPQTLIAERGGTGCGVARRPATAGHREPTKGDGQIAHFERRLNTGTGWSSSGFWVVRQDGTATDFSYIDAVKGKPKGRSQDFYGACRQAVALDLIQAKKQAFAQYGDDQGRVECELTGVMVNIDDAHLDHAWPNFSHLVSGFRAARGWSRDIPDGVMSAPADGQMTATFIDSAVADAFRTYHHDQAMLRILSRTANLQTASQARRPRVARPVRVPDR